MVLEHHGVKQPAASQPTAASRPQRRRSSFGSPNEIFSMKPAHLNDGWRWTVGDVPAPSGAHSTPTPTPSPLMVLLLLSSVYAGCVGWLTGGLLPGFVYLTLSESYSPFGTPLVFEMGKAGAGNW